MPSVTSQLIPGVGRAVREIRGPQAGLLLTPATAY